MRYYHLRPNNIKLPVPEGIQDFYYNHTNLLDGYLGAMVMDMILSCGSYLLYDYSQKLSENSYSSRIIEKLYGSKHLRNFTSGLTTIVTTTLLEFSTIGNNTPDIMDIPATTVGAILRTILRYSQIRSNNK